MISAPLRNVSDIGATLLIFFSQKLPSAGTFPCPFHQEWYAVTCSHLPGYHLISLSLRILSSSVKQCESTFLKRESLRTSRPGAIHSAKKPLKTWAWRSFFAYFFRRSLLWETQASQNSAQTVKHFEILREKVFTGALKLLFLYPTLFYLTCKPLPINCLVCTMQLGVTEIYRFIILNLMRAMAESFSYLRAQCLYRIKHS